jgi:hypothetical protein
VIHFGHFGGELAGVALREAPRDDELLARPPLLVGRHLEDRLDRLLLGLADEPARIDDDDLGVFGPIDVRKPRLLRGPEHDLAVDPVFDAAEADEVNRFPHFRHSSRGI